MDRWSLLRKVGGGIHKETAALKDEGITLPADSRLFFSVFNC
jgi:hypothetical protein